MSSSSMGRQSRASDHSSSAPDVRPAAGKTTLVEQALGAVAQAKRSEDAPPEAPEAAAPASPGHPLPEAVRIRMEEALKADFSAVLIRESSEALALGARAYTRGSVITFAPGEYDPSSERGLELLGHELAHVVQQGSGRVQATAQAHGMAVNDDAGLEHEADVAGAGAARGEPGGGAMASGGAVAAGPSAAAPAQMKLTSPIIQRKGEVKLMPQAGPTGDAPMADGVEELLAQMANYDALTDGRPEQQLIHLEAMVNLVTGIVASEPKAKGLKSLFAKAPPVSLAAKLKLILVKELQIVTAQRDRLAQFTATDDAPYEQMTQEGMLWNHPSYEHSTKNVGKTGKRYFQEMSSENVGEMQMEAATSEGGHARPNTETWFAEFVNRATGVLSTSVVNHYTTTARARQMLASGGMKSKVKLEKEAPEFKHNTSGYDDVVLANSGFLFFFIEAPDARPRGTRFADGDAGAGPARISIPIRDSGLLDRGWIMLSDFAQREYPDIQTNAANDRHASWLPTRPEEKNRPGNVGMTQPVRHFTQGVGDITPEDEAMMMDERLPQVTRNVGPMASVQAGGDAGSKQTYTGPDGENDVPDRIRNNILVGADIIPGLAMRAALEVSRIAKVNPALAGTMKALDGGALMTFMLKDLFRPQAMIPNSVEITDDHIQEG
jgi:Domain of unknown function (DUF4157)